VALKGLLFAAAFMAASGCATTGDAQDKECPVCPPCEQAKCPDAPKKAREPVDAKRDSVSADDPRTLKFRAFSKDSEVVALEVMDDRGGNFLEIRKLSDGAVVETRRLDPATAKSQWKKARRKHKLLAEAPKTASHPKDVELSLMGSDMPKWAVVNVAKGERVVPYYRIPRLDSAGVAFKTIAFSPDGKWIAVVHTQALMKAGAEVGHDFFHATKLKRLRLPF